MKKGRKERINGGGRSERKTGMERRMDGRLDRVLNSERSEVMAGKLVMNCEKK